MKSFQWIQKQDLGARVEVIDFEAISGLHNNIQRLKLMLVCR